MHPEYNVQDWDSAEGAIDWPRMIRTLREVRACVLWGFPSPRVGRPLSGAADR